MRSTSLSRDPIADDFAASVSIAQADALALLHAVPTMIYGCGADGCVSFVNLRLREFIGSRAERLLGRRWTGLLDAKDPGPSMQTFLAAQQARRNYRFKYRAQRCDQQYRVLIDCGEPRFAADGTFAGYVGSVMDITEHDEQPDESAATESASASDGRFDEYVVSSVDITDRRQAENLIRQSEARFRVLFDSDVVPLLYWHEDGRVLDANDAYLRLVGASRDEVEAGSLRWCELTPVEHLRLGRTSLAAVFAGKDNVAAFERDYVNRDGRRITALVAGSVLPGRADQGVAFAVDLTERKRLDAALRNSEALVRSVFTSLYGYVAVLDRSGTIIAVNDAWRQFAHGLAAASQAPGIGANYLELCVHAAALGDQTAASAVEGMRNVLSGRALAHTLEYRNPARDQDRWFEMSVLPLKRPEGGAVVFHLDMTARHRAEVEAQRLRNDLSHVTRVSIMGELTASLAHELNQPLTAILSNTQAALRMLGTGSPDPGELREILEDIAFDDQRAGDIITKLRQLMKKGQFQLQPVELNNVVLDVSTLLESDALIREMTIEHELTPNLPPVRGDRIQLQQVLLNLMLNGLEAMRTSPHDSRRKLLVSTHNDAQKVSVAVTDAGTGIPLERLDSIFEPFYTTKPDGMGMGLSISRSILIALGGRITGRNNPDRGATFEFELPVMTENQP